MQRLMLIGLAGLAGTLLRYWLSESTARRFGGEFPAGTLFVNLIGCFIAGFLLYFLFERYPVGETMRAIVFIGLLGGFTTFSAFGLQTFVLMREGQMGLAMLNIGVSNVGSLLMVWAGYSLARIA